MPKKTKTASKKRCAQLQISQPPSFAESRELLDSRVWRTWRIPDNSRSPLSLTNTRSLKESRIRSKGSWTPEVEASAIEALDKSSLLSHLSAAQSKNHSGVYKKDMKKCISVENKWWKCICDPLCLGTNVYTALTETQTTEIKASVRKKKLK